jgi:hypothetical protein
MARESGTKQERISISYFEGVNSSVQHVIARRTELAHMENARAPVIGVLEKREGQAVLGTASGGGIFATLGNFGLKYWAEDGGESKGLLRVTTVDGAVANIYFLNMADEWIILGDAMAQGLSLAVCDFANVDENLVIVNGADPNRMIMAPISGGTATMVDATTPGSLYNSPKANKVAFYKSRIYLADYYDQGGNELKTTVLRSSYPLGIISLLNGDVDAVDLSNNWVLPVTDANYFYTDAGMNQYEVYRGNQKVADITISDYTETSITAANADVTFAGAFSSFLSADEVWITGTFTGKKQYRWISNAGSVGRDVKQYDTFKLVGGDESGVTLLQPIGNILMIANRNTILTWNDYNLENFDLGVGCCSKNGAVKLKGSLYFLHYSGVYSTSGSMPQLLSRKIERYIKGATKAGLEAAAAGYKGLSVFFTIGDVTLYNNDGSVWKVLPQVCLEFNVADQNWYIHTNVTSTQFETYINTDGAERLAMCSLTQAAAAVLGPELVVNGSFSGNANSWTLGAGWTYGDNDVGFVAP